MGSWLEQVLIEIFQSLPFYVISPFISIYTHEINQNDKEHKISVVFL